MLRSVVFCFGFILAGCSIQPPDPLASAARSGDIQTIKRLLTQGADANGRSGVNGWTPLMHAIHKHQKASLETLIARGADVNARAGEKGMTALIMAAGYGYSDFVRILLDKGADAAAETSDGDSALAAAVSGVPDIDKFTLGKCQTETVAALLNKAPDLTLKNNFYGNAARAAGCSDVLRLMKRKQHAAHSVHGDV
jgi:hypothetical protein